MPAPKWTVICNLLPIYRGWTGVLWEFFNTEEAAIARYYEHLDKGNVPTKRSFNRATDFKMMALCDQHRLEEEEAAG